MNAKRTLFKLFSVLVSLSMLFSLSGAALAVSPKGISGEGPAVATKHNGTNWPLEDLRVRQAIAHCTDKAALAQASYPLLTRDQAEDLVMNTMIPTASPYYAGDANITIYAYDPTAGGALLDAAGWSYANVGDPYRKNAAGEELSLELTTTNAAFRQAWAAVWEQQLAGCGIRLVRFHAPASWWFGDTTGLARRDFEIGIFAWVGQADPGGYTLWACDQIPTAANGWIGQNYMGWCNPDADASIKQAVNTLDINARKQAYKVLQQEYTADVPAIPMFNRMETFSADANLTGFDPQPGEEYYVYNSQDWQIPGQNTIILGATQEPASLYTLVESSYITNIASYPVNPRSYISANYDFTPQLTIQHSTIESGLAANNSVLVEVGDTAITSSGYVETMALGTLVFDESGLEVAMDADGVMMKQMVATYTWRNDLYWSDGVKLSIADFQLGYQTACDPENGATSFYTCDRTQDVQFAVDGTNTYTVTYVPGHQDPFYYLAPYGYYPAHQIITTVGPYYGSTLSTVPAKDWPTLEELAERPIGVGPYMIVEWQKGSFISYTANPYAPTDLAPATPNLKIQFITPEFAETMLIAGQVDILGADTLAGLSEALVQAEASGFVKNYVIAGATWEHADLNLESVPPSYKPAADLRVRQAIAHCTDKAALAQAGYPLLSREQAESLVMNTFIVDGSPFYAGDENITIYDYDPAAGAVLLDAAGWTLNGYYRYNEKGEILALKLTTTSAAFRQAWAAVFEQQMRACGIQVVRLHDSSGSGWWFGDTTGLGRRDFELGAYAWVGQADPGGFTLWTCGQIPSPDNYWDGQNYAGWCNPTASRAVVRAVNSIDQAARRVNYKIAQQEFTKDLPVLPLFNRIEVYSTDVNLTGFAPVHGEYYYVYNAQDWKIPGQNTIVFGTTQEPPSLHTLVENVYITTVAAYLVNPLSYRSLNFEFTPQLTIRHSTIESGLASNNSVLVEVGDIAMRSDGEVATMELGSLVIDENGNEVAMDADGVMMKQIVATYLWRNDLYWSDGVKLSIADFQLGFQAICDHNNGSNIYNAFYVCDRTENIQFATDGTNTYTVTYVPGYQDPFYYLAPYRYYPAHQVITTPGPYYGQTLASVPPEDWSTLAEVAEKPLGIGPYKIVEWVRGDHITYAANPYAPADLAPETPNLIMKFIPPEEAETMLIDGQVDLLGRETLFGISDALVQAENLGIVKNYVISGDTWEHIDFHLDAVSQQAEVSTTTEAVMVINDAQNNQTMVDIPTGAATSTVTVELLPQTAPVEEDNVYQFAGTAFSLTAYENGTPLEDYQFAAPVAVTLEYSESDLAGVVESQLALYYWDADSSSWLDAADTCSGPDYLKNLDMVNNVLTTHICHLSEFAAFAPQKSASMVTLSAQVYPNGQAHLTATVAAGAVKPTISGQVIFHDGTRELGTASLSSNTAVLDVVLPPGFHLLSAYFVGNEAYDGSISVGKEAQTYVMVYLPSIRR